ncbi:MAG: hypothetical protein WBA17_04950 [Saprospiraceae bacterium]
MTRKYDNVWIGLVAGALIPFIAYALLLLLTEQLAANGIVAGDGSTLEFRPRTMLLIALCFNIIPLSAFRKRYMNQCVRGLVITTVIGAAVWFVMFGQDLLNGNI